MKDNEKMMCDLFADQLSSIGFCFKDLSESYNKTKDDHHYKDKDLLMNCTLNLLLKIKKKEYESNQTAQYSEMISNIENIAYVLGHVVYQMNDGNIYINTIYDSNINNFVSILLLGMKNQIDHKDEIVSCIKLMDCGYNYLTEPTERIIRKIVYNEYRAFQYSDNSVEISTNRRMPLDCNYVLLQFDHQLDVYELIDVLKKFKNAFLREEIINNLFDKKK